MPQPAERCARAPQVPLVWASLHESEALVRGREDDRAPLPLPSPWQPLRSSPADVDRRTQGPKQLLERR